MASAFQKRSHAYARNSDNIKTNEQGLQLLPKYRPMKTVISSWLLFRLLFQPTAVFAELSETRPEPHSVFLKFVVLIPALMWSTYLLCRGLPIVLKISPERGMLMASALIGCLLVALLTRNSSQE